MVNLRTLCLVGAGGVALLGGYLYYTAYVPAHYSTNVKETVSFGRQKTETKFWVSPGKEVVVSFQSKPAQPFYLWVNNQQALAVQQGETFVASLKPTLQAPAKIVLELHPDAFVKAIIKKAARPVKKGKQPAVETVETATAQVVVRSYVSTHWSWRRLLLGTVLWVGCAVFLYAWWKLPIPNTSTALVPYTHPPAPTPNLGLNSLQQWGIGLMSTGVAGMLIVYSASELAKVNPPSVTPVIANRVAAPPPTPLPPTPFPTEQPQLNALAVPPTPIPVLGPAWRPGPPQPTWHIPYGNIRFKAEMRFYSEQKDCESCRSNRVYGTQFPAQTPTISFACSYERDSQDILQAPIVMVWKCNGTEFTRDQVNWRFEQRSAEIGRSLVGGNFQRGTYQVDCYWNQTWIATGTYEVY